MRFRNTMHLLMDNFHLVYKMLLYKLIIALLTISIALSFIIPGFSYIFTSDELVNFGTTIQQFFTSLFTGDEATIAAYEGNIASAFTALVDLVFSKPSNLIGVIVGILLTYILMRFLDAVGNFSFGAMLDDKMSSYAEISFFASFTKNVGRGSVYGIFYSLICFVYDALNIYLCYLIFFNVITATNLFPALFLASLTVSVMQALKMTYLYGWMPAMITDGNRCWKAFAYNFKVKTAQKARMFSNYLVAEFIVVTVNLTFGVCTLGAALFVTAPASFLLYLCMQFVNYYTLEGKKYFVNHYKIARNDDKGEKSDFSDLSGTEEEEEKKLDDEIEV